MPADIDEGISRAAPVVGGHLLLADTPGLGCTLAPRVLAALPPVESGSFAERIGIPNP